MTRTLRKHWRLILWVALCVLTVLLDPIIALISVVAFVVMTLADRHWRDGANLVFFGWVLAQVLWAAVSHRWLLAAELMVIGAVFARRPPRPWKPRVREDSHA